MPRMTVSIPDEMLAEFKERFPDVNVAEVVRSGIIKKLEKLEELRERGEL